MMNPITSSVCIKDNIADDETNGIEVPLDEPSYHDWQVSQDP